MIISDKIQQQIAINVAESYWSNKPIIGIQFNDEDTIFLEKEDVVKLMERCEQVLLTYTKIEKEMEYKRTKRRNELEEKKEELTDEL